MTFSLDQLRRYTLGRGGLLDRFPASTIPQLGPLYAGDHTAPYLALHARIAGFAWEQFADLRYDERAFTRLEGPRGQAWLVPAGYVAVLGSAYNLDESDPFPLFAEYDISMEEAIELRFFITEIVGHQGPLTSAEVKDLLDPDLVFEHVSATGHQMTSIKPVLDWLWRLGLLSYGAGVHDWRHKDHRYSLAGSPPPPTDPAARAAADARLAAWYFALYGPASYDDWQRWAGLDEARARAAFQDIEATLQPIKVADLPGELWLPAAHYDEFAATPDTPPEMVRLLPAGDALLQAYGPTRARFYDPEGLAGDVAFHRHGLAEPTVWVDGRIIGIWSWQRKADEPMTVEPFVQMTRALRKHLKPEVDAVQAFIQASQVLWIA